MSCMKPFYKSVNARLKFLHIVLYALFSMISSSALAYDKITRILLEDVPMLQKGRNCIWRISTPSSQKHVDYVRFQNDKDTICVFADNWLSKFFKAKKGLYLASMENPNCLLAYDTGNMLTIPYDLQLNDSVNSCYNASGMYCGKYSMSVSGTQSIKLIGIGQIVENKRDTIDHVFLFVRNNIADFSISSIQQNSQIPIVKNEKSYFWIDAFSHHVVLNMTNMEFLSNGKLILRKSACYRYQCESSDGGEIIKDEQAAPSIFNYSLKVANKKMSIIYDCPESYDVKVRVCDITGILYHRRDYAKSQISSQGELNIDLSHLHSGVYVCYIYVNGQVYCKNFHL